MTLKRRVVRDRSVYFAAVSTGASSVVTARWSQRRFVITLAAVAVVGFAIRIAYVALLRDDVMIGGDGYFYHAGANLLADGHGYIQPYAFRTGTRVEAADHPPLYLLYLAIPSVFGMTSQLTHLLWSCVLGAATVVVIGLAGRAVVNARVGIIAAAIAAVYPNIWAPDGSLQAETASMFATAVAVLLAYRYLHRPSLGRLALVGASCGAAALARAELILLVPLIVVPLAVVTRDVETRQRFRWLAVAVLTSLVVVAPWVGYNLTRFRHPVLLSSQFEPLLSSANCDDTYYGDLLGYFSYRCNTEIAARHHLKASTDQSVAAAKFREEALDYISDHKERLPVVVLARIGRTLGIFRPGSGLRLDEFFDRRESEVAHAALYSLYALLVLSAAGGVILRRRRITVFPLLAGPAVVLLTTTVTYANTRFRTSAEVGLAVLAAVAIDAGVTRVAAKRERHEA